ncbi:MAG: GH25 family lysozyme [Acidobacteriota bacterium]
MRFAWVVSSLLLGSLPVVTAAAEAQANASEPRGIDGVDVSHFSGAVDWERVAAAGYEFAYVKATEGVDSLDPLFAQHWSALESSGLRRGAYHFYVTEDDPEEQARFFLDTVAHGPGDLLPAVDVEVVGHGTRPDWPTDLLRFLDLVEAELGARPIVYTGPKFWRIHLESHSAAADIARSFLWLAEYGVDAPQVPSAWPTWQLWQWRGNAAVDGVEKDVDLSRLNDSLDGLDALVIPSAEVAEP